MKNNKGFTLVELLASMAILAILMAITIPNIMGILSQNRNVTYIEDAEKLVSAAKYKYASSEFVNKKLANNQCYKMTLKYLNNGEFDDGPNGGIYHRDDSYVIIHKDGTGRTKYYVTIKEIQKKSNECIMYIPLTQYETLTKNEGEIVEKCGEGSGEEDPCHEVYAENFDDSKYGT